MDKLAIITESIQCVRYKRRRQFVADHDSPEELRAVIPLLVIIDRCHGTT